MKRGIALIIILSIVIVSTVIASIQQTKDIKPIASASVTKGDIRVTLVNIARTVSLSNQYMHDNPQGRLYAIPSVYVEFLIERLGNTPINSGPHITDIEFWENGKKISAIDSVVSGGVGGIRPYQSIESMFGFDMPSLDNPDRTRIRYESIRGIVFTSKTIEIRLQTAFDNNELKWFVFENIPIY
jgi:hypothetical protein